MMLLEMNGNGFFLLILIIGFVVFSPFLGCFFAGIYFRSKAPDKSKGFFIAGFVFLLIGLGVCGSMLS